MPTLNIGNQSVQVDDSFLNLSPAQQNATVDEIAKSLNIGSGSDANTLGDVAKSAGIGLAKGAINTLGMAGDLTDLASKGYDYLTGSNTNATVGPLAQTIGSQNIQKHIEDYTGKFYQPKTGLGQVVQTVGEFAPAAIGGGGSLASRLLTRAVAPALASEAAGQATQGTSYEPAARVIGAVVGGGLPVAASRIISPATIGADRAAAISRLADAGVTDMSAGMKTGNKAIQYAQSENAPAADAAANLQTLQQLTGSVMRQALVPDEINAGKAVPEILAPNRENLSNQFGALLANKDVIPISGFNTEANKILSDFKVGTNSTEAPAIKYFIDKVNAGTGGQTPVSAWPQQFQKIVDAAKQQGLPDDAIAKSLGIAVPKAAGSTNTISGQAYQSIQSELGKALKSSYGTPGLTTALGDLKDALDASVAKGLQATGDTQTFQKLQQLRGAWLVQNVLEKAVTNSGQYGAEHGVITPSALYNAVNSTSAKRNTIALGKTPLAQLARDAKAVIGNITPPQSGTAPRLAARIVPAAIAGGIGSLVGGPHAGLGAAAAMMAPMVASHTYGKVLMTSPLQRYLTNQAATSLRQTPTVRTMATGGLLALPAARNQ